MDIMNPALRVRPGIREIRRYQRLLTSATAQDGSQPKNTRQSVIINADDWGRDAYTTDRILECILHRVVSSGSAMVFMEDSERAAQLALSHQVDVGLHLNFTTPFSAQSIPSGLAEHQQRCMRFLRSHRLAPILYHPGLASSFRFVVQAQLHQFERLYGHQPNRIDGHHHMHLCANVLRARLIPEAIVVRRNFSFLNKEKSALNRAYRRWQDRQLAQRFSVTDFFFALPPLTPRSRLERIFDLAGKSKVEVETHPVNPEEFDFLMGEGLRQCIGQTKIARGYLLQARVQSPISRERL